MAAEKKVVKLTAAEKAARMQEKLPFMAPVIKGVPDLFVSVNGRKFLIQRGKQVMLPRYVVQHLANVEAQKVNVINMQMSKQQNVNSNALK